MSHMLHRKDDCIGSLAPQQSAGRGLGRGGSNCLLSPSLSSGFAGRRGRPLAVIPPFQKSVSIMLRQNDNCFGSLALRRSTGKRLGRGVSNCLLSPSLSSGFAGRRGRPLVVVPPFQKSVSIMLHQNNDRICSLAPQRSAGRGLGRGGSNRLFSPSLSSGFAGRRGRPLTVVPPFQKSVAITACSSLISYQSMILGNFSQIT